MKITMILAITLGICFSPVNGQAAKGKASHKASSSKVQSKRLVTKLPSKRSPASVGMKQKKAVKNSSVALKGQRGAKASRTNIAKIANPSRRGPASIDAASISSQPTQVSTHFVSAPVANKEFEVRGQSRNLSMMLVLRNDRDTINFVKTRDGYDREIQSTQF